ncbi:hypothetical protein [Lentilactobacillus farraginis]|uniref:D-alanyl-D-alanine carboxypeptidase n=1 Tax=Lentilactobacillus farraginis DSM 18382 = JCM 14108 TaxID=1423743 RepID=X0PAG4_9LACO|nr:hypothetical protein [Lentilactobacillus farraginis]KRM12207.1 hypothetical protein FD41_GL000563 [Lentilactobacillus farraginis DSM 18382 = JCM 14108]GAF36499.1 D-alanyl-D-alanine carboxypeptidase [Lentilactobacillus farraginis DSM 18382 = JCM 14108]
MKRYLLFLIISIGLGVLGSTSITTRAAGVYHPIKSKSFNNIPYHWNGNSSNAYLWNYNLTKHQHRLAHYPVTTWYVSKSLKMTNGRKTGIFYKVSNARGFAKGYVWKGYLSKGPITKGNYPAGLIDKKLNQKLISLFPGTIPNKQLQKLTEYYIYAIQTTESGDSYYDHEMSILGAKKVNASFGLINDTAAKNAYKPLRTNRISFLPFEKSWIQKALASEKKKFTDFSGWSIGAYAFPKNSLYYGVIVIKLLPPTQK